MLKTAVNSGKIPAVKNISLYIFILSLLAGVNKSQEKASIYKNFFKSSVTSIEKARLFRENTRFLR